MYLYNVNGSKILPNSEADIFNLRSIGAGIINGTIKKISLIGDSITDGAGGTGYNGSASTALSTNTAGYCWANMLKAYLGAKYGVEVTNYGQYGSGVTQQVDQFATTITADTDLVIWLTGTNNRMAMETYISVLPGAIESAMSKCANVIVMSGIPATEANETGAERDCTMWDIANIVTESAIAKGCKYLPMYNKFSEYCEDKGVEVGTLLKDGLHPNDAGYLVMLKILLRELGIPVAFYDDLSVNGDYYPFT